MEKFDNEWFSADLKSKRKSKKQTVEMAAKEIGISKATMSRLENENDPDINSLYKSCKWLGVSMEKYFVEQVPKGGFR